MMSIELSTPTEVEPFTYRWPGGDEERYARALQMSGSVDGKSVEVRCGLGRRSAYGRDRVRVVVFVDGQPALEATATDAYDDTHEAAAVLKLPSGRHARELAEVPEEYAGLDMRPFAEVIAGPPKLQALAIVLPSDDAVGWANVALVRSALRRRALAGEGAGLAGVQRWLFQANPRIFDLDAYLRSVHVGTEDTWSVTRFRTEIRPGDSVVLWQGGASPGIRAVGRITSDPVLKDHPEYTSSSKEWGVRYRLTAILAAPLSKSALLADPALAQLAVIRFPQATNYRVTAEEWTALVRVLRRSGVEVSGEDGPIPDPWSPFVYWASRQYERPEFGPQEIDYKVTIADHIRAARSAVLAGEPTWLDLLKRAFGSPNNLTPWQAHDRYLKWAQDNHDDALRGLRDAWAPERSLDERIDSFLATLPRDVVSGPGQRVVLASFLEMGTDEHSVPIYRPDPVRAVYRLTRFEDEPGNVPPSQQYAHWLRFLDTFIEEAAERGLVVPDRLVAQSLVWMVVKWDPAPTWSRDDQQAFLMYRSGGSPGEGGPIPGVLDDLVERFKDTGYPSEDHLRRLRERTELVEGLTREALAEPAISLLRRFGGPAFGSPGPQPRFMALLKSEDGPRRVASVLDHLLYGAGALQDRLDEILAGDRQLSGITEGLLTKALAVVYPDEWLPLFLSRGPRGKLHLLAELLDTPLDDTARTTGAVAVDSNAAIRTALIKHFPSDTFGMKEFLHWLARSRADVSRAEALSTLASRLHLDSDYLHRIVRLLADRGQIIFYGPPGTGKTYVARELARFLSGSGAMRKVQFHPSYAYEDFVEGYRPRAVNGRPGFELVPGPLKEIALDAQSDEAGQFVLLIDEINRGNVAKIFGELYYLLEYRDEEVALQYSADPFSLPRNLWIIGTMNTADRSIALVDAALRRRFHFVPFFPGEPPIKDLLRRWLGEHRPAMAWIADVLDRANALLDDPNVAIGPSYFLRADLTDEWVDLIWEHSVLPYLAEHFIGDENRLKQFGLTALRASVPGPATDDR